MAELIGLGQLRSHACAYFEKVLAGQTIEVVRRGRLVARIVPIANDRRKQPHGTLPAAAAVHHSGNRVGLEELRTRAGHLFDRVAAGETIEVAWRERLVARIESVTSKPRNSLTVATAAQDAGGRVGLAELRTRPGRFFDRVADGQTIEVVRRGKLVARIVPAAS